MAKNKEWPKGTLKQVSRSAYNAVRSSRAYDYMTPEERLGAAKAMDALRKKVNSMLRRRK